MTKPLLSIITVSYNAQLTIESTILSVIDQNKDLYEYWIIDGASTDGTVEIIKKYQTEISGWISEPDKGIYDAMNKGLDRVNGKWVFFLGADDMLMPNIIESLSVYFSNEVDLIFGKVMFTNNRIVESFLSYRTIFQNTLHHQSAIYNKKLFDNFRYDISFSILSDYELNLMLFIRKCKYVKTDLIISKCYENGASSNVKVSIFENNQIRRKHINNALINAVLSHFLVLYYEQKKYRTKLMNFFKKN